MLIGIWKIWQNSPENMLGNISQKHPWTYVLGQIPQYMNTSKHVLGYILKQVLLKQHFWGINLENIFKRVFGDGSEKLHHGIFWEMFWKERCFHDIFGGITETYFS